MHVYIYIHFCVCIHFAYVRLYTDSVSRSGILQSIEIRKWWDSGLRMARTWIDPGSRGPVQGWGGSSSFGILFIHWFIGGIPDGEVYKKWLPSSWQPHGSHSPPQEFTWKTYLCLLLKRRLFIFPKLMSPLYGQPTISWDTGLKWTKIYRVYIIYIYILCKYTIQT